MIRVTTNGVLKGYRSDLMYSALKRTEAMNTVLTQRNFNSYADDPAAASQSFQLRRSYLRTESQITISNSTIRKYNAAYGAMDTVETMIDTQKATSSWASVLKSRNDPTGSGRVALGEELTQLAESIIQTMNNKYGDNYTFAGADGLNVPFTWEGEGDDRKLYYRGVAVDTAIPEPIYETDADGNIVNDADGNPIVTNQAEIDAAKEELAKLDYMAGEKRYVDIGIGLQEDENGNLIEASAFNDALPGISFLGYGSDENGDSDNIASIIHRMGTILSRCDQTTGEWASDEDKAEFDRLALKFDNVSSSVKEKYVELSTRADFLNNNHGILENTSYTLNEQILEIDQVDLADAITSFSWAQYCYNAALKVGNSILSESLMDYMS